jgi:glycosyltransferase involved in cell wall biosynthesis
MPYLPTAVDSIVNQRLTSWRLIIVDDASSDDSEAYLQGLTDPRVTVLQLSTNQGQGVARNRALEHCDTKYVAVMDADDVSHPDRLAAQIAFLTMNPSVGAVGTQFAYLGSRGRTGFGSPLPCEHPRIYDDLLHGRHAIVNGTVCYRTSLLLECGGYAASRGGEDLDIYLRLAERSRLANLKGPYYLYRVHRKSTNATRLAEVQLQYSFALHNARRRLASLPEVSFEIYEDLLRRRPPIERLWNRLEIAARGLYRTGVGDVLHGHPLTGYTRLGVSALMSPGLAMRRLIRVAPPHWKRRLGWRGEEARVTS